MDGNGTGSIRIVTDRGILLSTQLRLTDSLLYLAMTPLIFLLPALLISGAPGSGERAEKKGPVRHVLVLKWTPDATPVRIREVTDALRVLKDKVPGILSFEHGANVSPEGVDQGFHHGYVVTFADEAARDAYLPHPAHAAFGEFLRGSGLLEDVFVVDYAPEP